MKLQRKTIVLASTLAIVAAAFVYLFPPPGRNVKTTGPLTPQDVAEIQRVVSRERAALVSGDFAPHRITNISTAEKANRLWRNLRERATGELRSIRTRDGEEVFVDFGDRLNSKIGYDYQLRRTTNGWRVVGVGYHGPSNTAGQ